MLKFHLEFMGRVFEMDFDELIYKVGVYQDIALAQKKNKTVFYFEP